MSFYVELRNMSYNLNNNNIFVPFLLFHQTATGSKNNIYS